MVPGPAADVEHVDARREVRRAGRRRSSRRCASGASAARSRGVRGCRSPNAPACRQPTTPLPSAHMAFDREAWAAAARQGMGVAFAAERTPDRLAVVAPTGDRTYAELNANANRLVRALRRRGLAAGDSVAILSSNRAEFAETLAACTRAGFRLTTVNWHLTPRRGRLHRRRLRGPGLRRRRRLRRRASPRRRARWRCASRSAATSTGSTARTTCSPAEDGADIDDPPLGTAMLYTSGTTGQPEGRAPGARSRRPRAPPCRRSSTPTGDVHLVHRPAVPRRAARLRAARAAHVRRRPSSSWTAGTPRRRSRLIERAPRHAHAHGADDVPPPARRCPTTCAARYDTSSLRSCCTAPRPARCTVKQRMIEWLGPGHLGVLRAPPRARARSSTPHTWLTKPGTVGQPDPADHVHRRRRGRRRRCPPATTGLVWINGAGAGPLRVLRRPGQDGRRLPGRLLHARRRRATSTRTASSSSPTAPPTSSSPAA